MGGLAKWVDTQPDPLHTGDHTYLGRRGLGLISEDELVPVDPGLNIRAEPTWREYIPAGDIGYIWINQKQIIKNVIKNTLIM